MRKATTRCVVHSSARASSSCRLSAVVLLLVSPLSGTAAPKTLGPDLERRVHHLVNERRAHAHLKPLAFDERLARIAREHSGDMVRRNFFGHVNPDRLDPTARGKRAGYTCRKEYAGHLTWGLGENLLEEPLYRRIRIERGERIYDWRSPEELATLSVTGWMNSSGHRRNILEPKYDKTGVGIAISADNRVYITQIFC